MTKKLIAMDIDGTIINPKDLSISPLTYQTIQLLAKDHVLVLASGRPPAILGELDKRLNIVHLVLANGRFVKSGDQVLLNDVLDPIFIDGFVKDILSQGYDVGFEGELDFVLASHQSKWVDLFHRHWSLPIPPINPTYHLTNPVLQIIVYAPESALNYFKKHYPDVQFTPSCAYGFDVNVAGGMKEQGVALIAQHLGFQPKDVVAIGDGLNDVGLLRYAETAIAMGDAPEALKKEASLITKTLDNEGFYHAFKILGYVEEKL